MPSYRKTLIPAAVALAASSTANAFSLDQTARTDAFNNRRTLSSPMTFSPSRLQMIPGEHYMIRGENNKNSVAAGMIHKKNGENGSLTFPNREKNKSLKYTNIEEDIEIITSPEYVNGMGALKINDTAKASSLANQEMLTTAKDREETEATKTNRVTKPLPVLSLATGDDKYSRVNAVVPKAALKTQKHAQAVDVKLSLIESPPEAFQMLADKGAYNAKACKTKTLASAVLGGMYVGMGGMLSLAVTGNMPGIAATNPGLVKFFFAAFFPVNLFVCLLAGGQLFTGNTANMAAAFCEKKASVKQVLRSWSLSYVGNLIGCVGFAVLCKYCGVLSGGAGDMAANLLATKTSMTAGPIFVKAFFCNWLVCLAVFLSSQARDMTGKYLGIFLPISAFVSIGFEHSVANMFILPAGLLSQGAGGVSIGTAIMKNMVPVTLGNAFSGSVLVGAMFSFLFGRVGDKVDAFKARAAKTRQEAREKKQHAEAWTHFASAI